MTADQQNALLMRFDRRPPELQPPTIDPLALEALRSDHTVLQLRGLRILRSIATRDARRAQSPSATQDISIWPSIARSQALLRSFATNETGPTRALAVGVLSALDSSILEDASRALLYEVLRHDSDPDVRSALVESLTRLNPKSELVLPMVALALADRADDVKQAAAEAVGALGLHEFAPHVAILLQRPSPDVKRTAAITLRRLKASSSPYLEALQQAIDKEQSTDVQRELRSTLQALTSSQAASGPRLGVTNDAAGARTYRRYCAICHGDGGHGGGAERAPSLVSPSFAATVDYAYLRFAISYGRPGTAMAAYGTSMGGPLDDLAISQVIAHIRRLSGAVPLRLPTFRPGNAADGARLYKTHCTGCHDASESNSDKAPSLRNPTFLYTARPSFIRHAIAHGREQTSMPPFKDRLSEQQIDDIATFVVAERRNWTARPRVVPAYRRLRDGVLNPRGTPASFSDLRENILVSPEDVHRALADGFRLLMVDARPPSEWHETHISGSVSLPYYDIEWRLAEIPRDGTWVIAYCTCPTHLAAYVVNYMRSHGYPNAGVLDGGLHAWVGRGYGVSSASAPPARATP